MTKRLHHSDIREAHVIEAQKHQEIDIYWMEGKSNPADLFTKEDRDVNHYCALRDLMVRPREWIHSGCPVTPTPYSTLDEVRTRKVTFADQCATECDVTSPQTIGFGFQDPIVCTIPSTISKTSLKCLGKYPLEVPPSRAPGGCQTGIGLACARAE